MAHAWKTRHLTLGCNRLSLVRTVPQPAGLPLLSASQVIKRRQGAGHVHPSPPHGILARSRLLEGCDDLCGAEILHASTLIDTDRAWCAYIPHCVQIHLPCATPRNFRRGRASIWGPSPENSPGSGNGMGI